MYNHTTFPLLSSIYLCETHSLQVQISEASMMFAFCCAIPWLKHYSERPVLETGRSNYNNVSGLTRRSPQYQRCKEHHNSEEWHGDGGTKSVNRCSRLAQIPRRLWQTGVFGVNTVMVGALLVQCSCVCTHIVNASDECNVFDGYRSALFNT